MFIDAFAVQLVLYTHFFLINQKTLSRPNTNGMAIEMD